MEGIETIDIDGNKENFYLRLASVLTKDNKDNLEALLKETCNWPIDFHEVILVSSISMIICLIAAIFPAYRSSKIDPIKTIKND